MSTLEIALRLGVAALVGVALGLNRDLHGKPTGVRTLGLVGLGSALIVLAVGHGASAETSRVIQGILTGIGFLGAGVILRNETGKHIHGLTTAACVWLTACIGAACGVSDWVPIALGIPMVFAILMLGRPLERIARQFWPRSENSSID